MIRILTISLGLLAATTGCCLCAHPFDYCYPTCDGACGGACCEHDGRVLSAFSPRHDPYYAGEMEGEMIEGDYMPAPAMQPEPAPESPDERPMRPLPMPENNGTAGRWQPGLR